MSEFKYYLKRYRIVDDKTVLEAGPAFQEADGSETIQAKNMTTLETKEYHYPSGKDSDLDGWRLD